LKLNSRINILPSSNVCFLQRGSTVGDEIPELEWIKGSKTCVVMLGAMLTKET
jgi:hypothetical protein